MQFLTKLSKVLTFSFAVIGCRGFVALSQTVPMQANIIAPGAKPVAFIPGVVTTPDDEFAPSFTHDGNTVYFSSGSTEIYFSKQVNGNWSKPKVASFSGKRSEER